MTEDAERQALQVRLGRRLRELRVLRRMSQLDVVRNHAFGLSHWQKLERGTLDPKLSTLKKAADTLGVSLSELLAGI